MESAQSKQKALHLETEKSINSKTTGLLVNQQFFAG